MNFVWFRIAFLLAALTFFSVEDLNKRSFKLSHLLLFAVAGFLVSVVSLDGLFVANAFLVAVFAAILVAILWGLKAFAEGDCYLVYGLALWLPFFPFGSLTSILFFPFALAIAFPLAFVGSKGFSERIAFAPFLFFATGLLVFFNLMRDFVY